MFRKGNWIMIVFILRLNTPFFLPLQNLIATWEVHPILMLEVWQKKNLFSTTWVFDGLLVGRNLSRHPRKLDLCILLFGNILVSFLLESLEWQRINPVTSNGRAIGSCNQRHIIILLKKLMEQVCLQVWYLDRQSLFLYKNVTVTWTHHSIVFFYLKCALLATSNLFWYRDSCSYQYTTNSLLSWV